MRQREADRIAMSMNAASAELSERQEDLLRADLYDFLAAMLARPPSRDLLDRAAALAGDDSDICQTDEQAVLNDTGNRMKRPVECLWV